MASDVSRSSWGARRVARILFPIAALAVFAAGLLKHTAGPPTGLLAGRELPRNLRIEGDGSERLDLADGRWHLLIVGSISEDSDLIRYTQILLESGRLRNRNLAVAVITREGRAAAEEFRAEYGLRFPLFPFEEHVSEIAHSLSLQFFTRKVVLLDPGLQVVFLTDMIRKRDLRLVLERHLAASEKQPESPVVAPLKIGDVFPEVRLIAVDGASSQEGPATWVILTSRCTGCALDNYLTSVATAERRLLDRCAAEQVDLKVLFTRHFDRGAVAQRVRALQLQSPAYVAAEELASVEDPYLEEPHEGHDILVVTTDSEERVRRIESFAEYSSEVPSE